MTAATAIDPPKSFTVLADIPVTVDIGRVMTRLRFYAGNAPSPERVRELVRMTAAVVRLKALYKVSAVSEKTAGSLAIDGVRFSSPLLRLNLASVQRVFPYAVTIGRELESFRIPDADAGTHYCLDLIKEMVLESASEYVKNQIATQFSLDYLWSFSPGEWGAWPVAHRRELFSILGNVETSIGVRLGANGSLDPVHTQAGIFYFAETEFESCQVCPTELCMMRRAPYSPELAGKYRDRAGKPCGTNVA